MEQKSRAVIALFVFCLLVTLPWERAIASNLAMNAIARCLVPVKWSSYHDHPSSLANNQLLPQAVCLNAARQMLAQGEHRVQARMAMLDGDLAAAVGKWLPAIEHYHKAATLLNYDMPDLWNTVSGIMMLKLKDPSGALTVTLQALQQSPSHQGLRTRAAELFLFYVPPYSDAVRALAAMQPKLGFTHPYPYTLAAGAYLHTGKTREGLQMAEQAVRLGRAYGAVELANALKILGIIQRCTGQYEAGLANLRDAQTLVPGAVDIQAALDIDIQSGPDEEFRSVCGPVVPKP